MTNFSAKDTKVLESNADQFISSIALAEDSKCDSKIKEFIISKIKEVIVHSEIVIDELLN